MKQRARHIIPPTNQEVSTSSLTNFERVYKSSLKFQSKHSISLPSRSSNSLLENKCIHWSAANPINWKAQAVVAHPPIGLHCVCNFYEIGMNILPFPDSLRLLQAQAPCRGRFQNLIMAIASLSWASDRNTRATTISQSYNIIISSSSQPTDV